MYHNDMIPISKEFLLITYIATALFGKDRVFDCLHQYNTAW